MAIIQAALTRQKQGKHLITTAIEHPAVLNTFKYLEEFFGFKVTYLPVDQFGNFSLRDFEAVLDDQTILVSIMFANNEIGNLMPIKEVGKILANHQALFHTDAIQAYGVLDIVPDDLGIDLLSVSGHKINGPKGVGFLYQKRDLFFEPFLHGGEQENGRRAGTENLAGIWGMAQAVKILTSSEKKQRWQKYQELEKFLFKFLQDYKIDFRFNGNLNQKLPQIVNLQIVGIDSGILLTKLDLAGIAISAGSACTAGALSSSHVLREMKKSEKSLNESIRISFGYENDQKDLLALAKTIKKFMR
jgi:cysteine desulfurase